MTRQERAVAWRTRGSDGLPLSMHGLWKETDGARRSALGPHGRAHVLR